MSDDFEQVGYKTGWFAPTGGINHDYGDGVGEVAIAGERCLRMAGGHAAAIFTLSGHAEFWGEFLLRVPELPASGSREIIKFRRGSSENALIIYVTSTGQMTASAVGAGTSATSTGFVVAGEIYKVKFYRHMVEPGICTVDAQLLGDTDWTSVRNQSNATGTYPITEIYLYAPPALAHDIDNLFLYDAEPVEGLMPPTNLRVVQISPTETRLEWDAP